MRSAERGRRYRSVLNRAAMSVGVAVAAHARAAPLAALDRAGLALGCLALAGGGAARVLLARLVISVACLWRAFVSAIIIHAFLLAAWLWLCVHPARS
jgi:hypothetical protein